MMKSIILAVVVLGAAASARAQSQVYLPDHLPHLAIGGSGLPHGIPDFCASPTISSTRDGVWSDPGTWTPARVPVAGDKVSVRHAVTYDLVSDAPLHCAEVYGSLLYRSNIATRLTVGTLMVYPGGTLQIGTVANPIIRGVTAELVIANQPLDTAFDPEQFGTGLISFGTVVMTGQPRLAWTRLAADVAAGATSVTVSEDPTGWSVGSQIVIPDTRHVTEAERNPYVPQWERRTITAISGRTVTVTQPFTYAHVGSRSWTGAVAFLPHAANMYRNVIVRSANPSGTRGHVLFTQRADVHIRYVKFIDLGRTTMQPLDSTTFDANDKVTHVGTNQIGRYPLHLHHLMGPYPVVGPYQYELVGNVIESARKWGITVHASHYGLVRDNIIYNVDGSGLMTEDGSESYNVFEHNFVMRVNFLPRPYVLRGDERGMTDLGWEGTGFWLRGTNNSVRDNVAANLLYEYGYKFMPVYVGVVKVPNFPGADTTQVGQFTSVLANALPIREFARNETYGATNSGLTYWWIGTQDNSPVPNMSWSVVKDFRAWHVWDKGIYNYPSNMMLIDGLIVRGQASAASGFSFGYFAGDYMARHTVITHADIQGMGIGVGTSTNAGGGVQAIRDSYLRNGVNVQMQTLFTSGAEARNIGPRKVVLRNVTWSLPQTGPPENPLSHVQMWYRTGPVRHMVQHDELYAYNINGSATDHQRIVYSEQGPTFLVPVTEISPYNTHQVEGAPVAGLTNQQTWATYGLAIAGMVAPCTTTRVGIVGFACPIPWIDPSTDGLPGVLVLSTTNPRVRH